MAELSLSEDNFDSDTSTSSNPYDDSYFTHQKAKKVGKNRKAKISDIVQDKPDNDFLVNAFPGTPVPSDDEKEDGPISDVSEDISLYQPLDPKLVVDMPTLEEINKLMECAFCTRIPLAGAFVCGEGHLLCRHCGSLSQKLGSLCPVVKRPCESLQDDSIAELCKAKLNEAKLGPLAQLFQLCKYKCPSANCGVTGLTGVEMDQHTQICTWRRMVQCPEKSCDAFSMPFEFYVDHLEKYHEIPLFKGPSLENFIVTVPFSKDKQGEQWPIAIIEAFKHHFVIRMEHKADHFVFIPLLLDARAQKPNKHEYFQVQLVIKSAQAPANKSALMETMKWVGPVFPFLQEIEECGSDEDANLLELVMNLSACNSKPDICFPLYKEFVYLVNPYPRPPQYTINLSISIIKRCSFGKSPELREFSSRLI